MASINTSIIYRPIKIGFCVDEQNLDDMRKAVKLSSILCGGCFNPIIPVHDKALSKDLVIECGVDILYQVSDTPNTQEFIESFPYLKTPFDMLELYGNPKNGKLHPKVLDILPIVVGSSKKIKSKIYSWEWDDPLRDVFLTTFGAYPDKDDFQIDYQLVLEKHLGTTIDSISKSQEHPSDFIGQQIFTPYDIMRLNLIERRFEQYIQHYYGFYIGDATNFDDLVDFWNLRASGCNIFFYDPSHASRFKKIID